MSRKFLYLLVALLWGATASADSRTGDKPGGPSIAAVIRPCTLAAPVTAFFRRTALERHWRPMEKELEEPLRALIMADLLSQEALLSLEQRVLQRYDWTLTRYLVRTLRELEAPDLQVADRLLRLEAYAEHALGDAAWDGTNGWDVVSAVRAETLQVLTSLEMQRTAEAMSQGEAPNLADSGDASQHGAQGGAAPADPSSPQGVVARLLRAAAEREPYAVGSSCAQPRDHSSPPAKLDQERSMVIATPLT